MQGATVETAAARQTVEHLRNAVAEATAEAEASKAELATLRLAVCVPGAPINIPAVV